MTYATFRIDTPFSLDDFSAYSYCRQNTFLPSEAQAPYLSIANQDLLILFIDHDPNILPRPDDLYDHPTGLTLCLNFNGYAAPVVGSGIPTLASSGKRLVSP